LIQALRKALIWVPVFNEIVISGFVFWKPAPRDFYVKFFQIVLIKNKDQFARWVTKVFFFLAIFQPTSQLTCDRIVS